MQLKISAHNQETFEYYLTSVLNIATVFASGGYIPDDLDIKTPTTRGRYWFREKQNGNDRFHLYPINNDYWVNVLGEYHSTTEHFIVIEIKYRYDRFQPSSCDVLMQLLAMRFDGDNVILIQ